MSSDGIATTEVAGNAEGFLKPIINSLRATLMEFTDVLAKLSKLNTEGK